jgi:hypothetical protein
MPSSNHPAPRPNRAGKRYLGIHHDEPEFRRFKIAVAKLGWTTEAGLRFLYYEAMPALEAKAEAEKQS